MLCYYSPVILSAVHGISVSLLEIGLKWNILWWHMMT